MKLLIVDDEELTRTGVISSIDWKALGIEEVLQADDGINGLEIARKYRPEIILCDVRMPRMTGIAMLEKLENILPDSIPIFMSGYSDKDYLKAAIKLKAVNYIEKPLNPSEIREAVLEARERYLKKVRSHRGEALQSMKTASHLAQLLTTPCNDTSSTEIQHLITELLLPSGPGIHITCAVIHLHTVPEFIEPSPEKIYQKFHLLLSHYHADCVFVAKKLQYLVYFIFTTGPVSSTLSNAMKEFLCEQFQNYDDHFIALGESFTGISHAYQAYTSAVILLESSFFFPVNSYLTPEMITALPLKVSETMPTAIDGLFSEALTSQNNSTCQELHNTLIKQTDLYFEELQTSVPEHSTIFLIKDYISKNYNRETLSVKDISSHVFLSASYVCTFFKNETGQTLNQYLTEYRMEKAKNLLADPRYKIADISSRVGYSDGNYFGKSFKKYTGLSPSEYREKLN